MEEIEMVEMDGVAGEEEEEGREGGDTSAQLLQARHRMETRGRVVSNIIAILLTNPSICLNCTECGF